MKIEASSYANAAPKIEPAKAPAPAGVSSFRSSMEIRENAHGVWDCCSWISDFFKQIFSWLSFKPKLSDAELERRFKACSELFDKQLSLLIQSRGAHIPGGKFVGILSLQKFPNGEDSKKTMAILKPMARFEDIQEIKRAFVEQMREFYADPAHREKSAAHFDARLTIYSHFRRTGPHTAQTLYDMFERKGVASFEVDGRHTDNYLPEEGGANMVHSSVIIPYLDLPADLKTEVHRFLYG